MKQKQFINIFVIVFIGLLGFGLILPLIPYYAEQFGATPTMIGFLVASYAAMQMIGAPILGRLSDRFGRRPILLVSMFGTVIGYLIFGFAGSLWMLFLGRMVDGITGGNISVAQAYISDITDKESRARGMGLIGAAFGLGFIFGPAIGGALSVYGYAVPAFVAAGLALISWLLVLVWLPESLPAETRRQRAVTKPQRSAINLQALREAFARPQVGPLLTLRFGVGLAFSTFESIFALYALERFSLSAQQTGYILAYIGVLVVLVQGGAIGPLTKRFAERGLLMWGVSLTGLALLGWALAPSIPLLLVALAPMALGMGIFNTVINSFLSKVVETEEVGGVLGISSSLESLTRVIAPSASGYLIGKLGAAAPGLGGAALMGIMAIYAWQRLYLAANAGKASPPQSL